MDTCEVELDYSNTVERIHEDPRVTKPYTDDQWQRVEVLGKAIDARLEAGDVRLTMGGEPTFVSIDDFESPEWTLATDDPLTFDLVDRYNGRVIGGCRYHVAHPGGRSEDIYPVNAREAEARRMARYEPQGHAQSEFEWREPEPSPDMPFTLDLRRSYRYFE